jgi:hypothetical protein
MHVSESLAHQFHFLMLRPIARNVTRLQKYYYYYCYYYHHHHHHNNHLQQQQYVDTRHVISVCM